MDCNLPHLHSTIAEWMKGFGQVLYMLYSSMYQCSLLYTNKSEYMNIMLPCRYIKQSQMSWRLKGGVRSVSDSSEHCKLIADL